MHNTPCCCPSPTADQWPQVFDDSMARRDWGWRPRFDLPTMCEAMMKALVPKYRSNQSVDAVKE